MAGNRGLSFRSLIALLALSAAVSAGCGSGGAEKSASGAPLDVSSQGSNIYTVDVGTKRVAKLTDNIEEQIAQDPAWSKTGRIVFSQAASDESFAKLYLVAPDQPAKPSIVHAAVKHLFQPSWAPDGRRVVANRLGRGIYSIEVGNGATARLTSSQADQAPAWSPNGKQILFEKQVSSSNRDIYVMRPSGRGQRRVAHSPLQETNPSWSPDGASLAFAEQEKSGNWVIYTMRLDGSGRKAVTPAARSSQEPAWSPDGGRIAFVDQAGGGAAITVLSLDGGTTTRLTGHSFFASGPAWSPDGKRIVFSAKTVTRVKSPAG